LLYMSVQTIHQQSHLIALLFHVLFTFPTLLSIISNHNTSNFSNFFHQLS